jgi:ribulose-phosphate 3-epimerase
MIKIVPSILSADIARLGDQVREAEAGGADFVQVDVMDGHFVPNITFGPLVVMSLRPITKMALDVHLMIEQPERYLEAFARAGADILTVHQEATVHLHRTLQAIRDLGVRPGVAINPATPLTMIEEVLDMVDVVLVMTVNPGFGGQKFIQGVVPKLVELRRRLDERGLRPEVEVDGGIDAETAPVVVRAGATALVAGSAVFNGHAPIAQNIAALRQSVANLAPFDAEQRPR